MNKKSVIISLIVGLVVIASLAAVYAKEEDAGCVPIPSGEFGVATITQGVSFILAGGIAPLIILVIAFIVGLVVSHVIWGGF